MSDRTEDMTRHDPERLPEGLPAPEDDGACDHLTAMALPAIALRATDGEDVDLSRLGAGPSPRRSGCGRVGGRGAPDGAVKGALEATGLVPLADLPCRFLSAGQRRRLALARVIAGTRPLWLLDEPTSGLDHDAVGAFENAVGRHCRSRQGMAVIATHTALSLEGARTLELSPYAEKAREQAAEAAR